MSFLRGIAIRKRSEISGFAGKFADFEEMIRGIAFGPQRGIAERQMI